MSVPTSVGHGKMSVEDLRTHLRLLPRLGDKGREERVRRAKEDFRFCVETYFAHHVSKEETSLFRKDYYKNIKSRIADSRKMSVEAYRGAAKTTLVSRLTTLWLTAVAQEKRHVVIISSTIRLSKETLEFLKAELEENEQLISDFEITKGDKWSEEEIIFSALGSKIRILVYGAGTKIRGGNWLGFRPDLIICDDVENDENVESKNQRDKLYNWFLKAIMKLPARQSQSYTIIVVGTKLHHDGLLSRLQSRADFENLRFPLVLEFPPGIDGLDKYKLKKEDASCMVLDDPTLDAYELLKEFLEDKDSFMSEYQNEPLSRDGTSFAGYVTYTQKPKMESYTIGVDPSLGKSQGDYFATTVLGYAANKWYASTKMVKLKPAVMIDRIIALYISLLGEGVPIKIGIETVQFQEFFKDQLDERAKSIGLKLPIVPLKNTANKELRIDAVAPPVADGTILIDATSHLLIDELDTYPKAPHDDGLDSLEMAWRIAKKPAFDYKQALKHLQKREAKEKALKAMLGT